MPQKSADFVLAVFMDFNRKLLLMFESRSIGAWTFPNEEVRDGESELDAVQRCATEALPDGFKVDVVEQLGPLHDLLWGDKTGKAFICFTDGEPVVRDGHKWFAQCALFTANDLLTAVKVSSEASQRVAWDAFSVMEEPVVRQKQLDFDVEGYFCDPGMPHLLVKETSDQRLEWRRLRTQDGRPIGIL